MGSREVREGSGGVGGGGAVAASSVPRSVSAAGVSTGAGAEPRSTSKAERLMGISAADAQGSRGGGSGGGGGGTYRAVDSYQ